MVSYFKPWRRKFGVLTLALACLFLMAWVRSFQTTNDHITVWKNHSLYSHTGSISWNIHYLDLSSQSFEPIASPQSIEESLGLRRGIQPNIPLPKVKARWERWGLVYSDTVYLGRGTKQYWIIYWYFISPLTLLSAWFLFSKPRVAKLKPASNS